MSVINRFVNLFTSTQTKIDRVNAITLELDKIDSIKDLLVDQFQVINKALESDEFMCKNEISVTKQDHIKTLAKLKYLEKSLRNELILLEKNDIVNDYFTTKKREDATRIIKSLYREGKLGLTQYNEVASEKTKLGQVKYADVIVLSEKNEILLLKRCTWDTSNAGADVIPGGHVDKGESGEEAAKRELLEESGISVWKLKDESKNFIWTHVGTYTDENAHIEYYCLRLNKNDVEILLDEKETRDYKWVPQEELVNYPMVFNMRDNIMKVMGWEDYPQVKTIRKAIGRKQVLSDIMEDVINDHTDKIEKSIGHKYIGKVPNGKGGWRYIYKNEDPGIKYLAGLVSLTQGKQKEYFQKQLKNAKPVKITKIDDVLDKGDSTYLSHLQLKQKECYHNAWKIATNIPGVNYVEGIAFLWGTVPIEHAWNEKGGKYFDATDELVLKSEGKNKLSGYTTYLTLTGDETNNITLKTHKSGPYFQELFFKGEQYGMKDIIKHIMGDVNLELSVLSTIYDTGKLNDDQFSSMIQKSLDTFTQLRSQLNNDEDMADNINKSISDFVSGRLAQSISLGERTALYELFPEAYESAVKSSLENISKALESDLIDSEIFEKAMRNVSHLIPKKVQVKGKDGIVHQAIRWVNPDTGESEKVSTPKKEVIRSIAKVEGENTEESEFQANVLDILTQNIPKSDKVRNLINLGLYDKNVLSVLTGMSTVDTKWYVTNEKEGNIDLETLNDKTKEIKTAIETQQAHNDTPEDLERNKLLNASRDVKKLWENYDRNLTRVATGRHKFAVCYGKGGVGKTYHCEKILEKLKLREYEEEIQPSKDQYDYVVVKGKISSSQVFAEMYRHRDKLIIFDDCDSFLKLEEVQGWLKGGLDTGENTKISNKTSKKMYMIEGDKESGEIPNTFRFMGRVIAISNLTAEDIDEAVFSRALTSNLTMTLNETIEQLGHIKDHIKIFTADKSTLLEVSQEARDKAFELLKDYKEIVGDATNTRVLSNAMLMVQDSLDEGRSDEDIRAEVRDYYDAINNTFGKQEKERALILKQQKPTK